MPRQDLSGRVIAITGASSGIGAATALACARAGMDVVLGARRVEKLEAVAGQVRAVGRRALVLACDVDKDEDVARFIAAGVEEFRRLDVAFANAGYGINAPVMATTDAQMRAIFETNYYGTLRVIHAAVPVMRRAGKGHVIICSSAASEMAPPGYGAYAATKAAQDSIASALRAELAGENIFVTSVHPVGTSTEFLERVSREAGKAMGGNTPKMFHQTAERVAGAIVMCIGQARPAAEVWPMPLARVLVAVATALPGLTAAYLRGHERKKARDFTKPEEAKPQDAKP